MQTHKQELVGFSRLRLFEVEQNDFNGYSVGAGKFLVGAQKMQRDAQTTPNPINADDGVFDTIVSDDGTNITLTHALLSIEDMAWLGFGVLEGDTLTNVTSASGKTFAATFVSPLNDGHFKLFRRFLFNVNSLKDSGLQSKQGGNYTTFDIGVLESGRMYDLSHGEEKISDGVKTLSATDLAWLDTIETVGSVAP